MYSAKLAQHAKSAWLRLKAIEARADYNKGEDGISSDASYSAQYSLGLALGNVDFSPLQNTEVVSDWATLNDSENAQSGSRFSTDSANSGSLSNGESLSTPPLSFLVDSCEIPKLPQFTASASICDKSLASESHAASQSITTLTKQLVSDDHSETSVCHALDFSHSMKTNLCGGLSLRRFPTKTLARVNATKFYFHDDESQVSECDTSSELPMTTGDQLLASLNGLDSLFIESTTHGDSECLTISQILEKAEVEAISKQNQLFSQTDNVSITWMPCIGHPRWDRAPAYRRRMFFLGDEEESNCCASSYFPPGSANPSRFYTAFREPEPMLDPLRMIPVGGDFSLRNEFATSQFSDSYANSCASSISRGISIDYDLRYSAKSASLLVDSDKKRSRTTKLIHRAIWACIEAFM